MSSRPWKQRSNPATAEEMQRKLVALQAETGLSALTLQVCLLRGLDTADSIKEFLSPRLEQLKDPFTIKDMDRAVDRATAARDKKEKVRIFGDYDVDGTTGASLLTWVLREFGFDFTATQPDRMKDGYGLNVRAVEEAAADGVSVLITVDCGITSFSAAEKAAELGIDLIVLDHHQIDPEKGLPKAYAVVDPHRADCTSGLKQLCGCGLAFYFSRALRTKGRDLGWWPAGKEPNLKQHLDLVVLATAADMVPLTGDNHTLVRHGLQVLKYTKKPGMRALLEVTGIGSGTMSPSSLGFVLGPRINASGRMGSAGTALELLTTTDAVKAAELARELEQRNQDRMQVQNQIWDQVRGQVEAGLKEGKFENAVAVGDASWHEGVIGIVASRVVETFRKPAAVAALREDHGKGSVRTYSGKSVLEGLRRCAPHLLGFGGHQHAAGFSVAAEKFQEFAEAFDQAMGEVPQEHDSLPLFIEGSCAIEDLNVKTLQEIENLGPFGPGNPEPVFTVKAAARSHRVLKGRHLKLNLAPVGTRERALDAIWFHAADQGQIKNEDSIKLESEWAGVPELNRYRGRITPSFRVKDWRPV